MRPKPQSCGGCAASFVARIGQHEAPTPGWGLPTLILVLSIVLAACSTKDEPSAANFERAINAALKEQRLCTHVSLMDAVQSNDFLSRLSGTDAALAERVRAEVEASKAKILEFSSLHPDAKQSQEFRILTVLGPANLLHGGKTYQYRPVLGFRAEVGVLNERGMTHYVETTEKRPMLGPQRASRICYGNIAVDKVIRWTAPADYRGHRVVNVEYTLKAIDVADWAKPMVSYLKQEKVRKALMVLSNEGWSVDEPSDVR